jgi:hypothetical protein
MPPPGGPPGDERLHWDPILEPADDIPCFGALPLACLVLPGDPAFDSLHIHNNHEASSVTTAPMFACWFAGLQYLYQHNHGMSLQASNMLSTWAEVTTTKFDALPLPAAPTVLLKGIGSLDYEHHVNMAVIFKVERMVAYFRFSQSGRPKLRQTAPTSPSPLTTNGVSVADLQRLIQDLYTQPAAAPVRTATSAERERAKESEGATIKYRLLFGRTVEVEDPSDPSSKLASIHLKLTPVFLQVLQASKITAAVQFIQDEIEHTVKGLLASDNFLESTSDVPVGMFDRVFIQCDNISISG